MDGVHIPRTIETAGTSHKSKSNSNNKLFKNTNNNGKQQNTFYNSQFTTMNNINVNLNF